MSTVAKKRAYYSQEDKAEYRKKMADERQGMIADGVQRMRSSQGWRDWLEFLGSFHAYSFNNQMLIQVQCPSAIRVSGFKQWQARGRQVRKGEKSIQILRPTPFIVRDADGKPEIDDKTGKPVKRMTFAAARVFDVSQTDPMPGVEGVDLIDGLHGDLTDDLALLRDRLVEVMEGKGWTVRFERIREPGVRGYCAVDGSKTIVVDDDRSPVNQVKTLIHESGHALLHTDLEGVKVEDWPKSKVRELEAESVAYTVCHAYGLDASEFSLKYLVSWKADDDAIAASADRIRKTVHAIIDAVEAGDE